MENELKKEFLELRKQLFLFCLKHKIPMFSVFAEETEEGTVYENTTLTPHDVGVTLSNDKITKYSASLNKNFELRFKSNVRLEDDADYAVDDLLTEE